MARFHPSLLLLPLCLALLGGCTGGAPAKPVPPAVQEEGRKSLPVDLGDLTLAKLGEKDLSALQRYLAGSPRWRLVPRTGGFTATQRFPGDESSSHPGKLRISQDGFSFLHQPWRRFRVRIHFGAAPDDLSTYADSMTESAPGSIGVPLKMTATEGPDLSSCLMVTTPHARLEIIEESMDPGREITGRLFRETCRELARALKHREEIGKWGMLASERTRHRASEQRVALERSGKEAWHLVGTVNAGEPGSISTRLAGAEAEAVLAAATTETAGWSKDRSLGFMVNSNLPASLLKSAKPGAAPRVELWFQPENSSVARKLATSAP